MCLSSAAKAIGGGGGGGVGGGVGEVCGGGNGGGDGLCVCGVCPPLCKICFKIANCFQQSMQCTAHWSSRVLHALFNNSSPDDCRLPPPPTKSYPQTATDMETLLLISTELIFLVFQFLHPMHMWKMTQLS